MTNMSKVTITAAAVTLVLALGMGAYQVGKWNQPQALPDQSSAQPTPTQAYAPATVRPVDAPPNYTGNMPPPSTAIVPGQGSVSTMNGAVPPQRSEDIPPGQSTYLTREVPTSDQVTQRTTTYVNPSGSERTTTYVNPSGSETTVIEKKTVVYEPHTVYRRHIVAHHHRKSDKVHVARAAKHATMFAAKLPGRIRM
jgi:hypothetical protein